MLFRSLVLVAWATKTFAAALPVDAAVQLETVKRSPAEGDADEAAVYLWRTTNGEPENGANARRADSATEGDADEAAVYLWRTANGEPENGAKTRRAGSEDEGDADEAAVYLWRTTNGEPENGSK